MNYKVYSSLFPLCLILWNFISQIYVLVFGRDLSSPILLISGPPLLFISSCLFAGLEISSHLRFPDLRYCLNWKTCRWTPWSSLFAKLSEMCLEASISDIFFPSEKTTSLHSRQLPIDQYLKAIITCVHIYYMYYIYLRWRDRIFSSCSIKDSITLGYYF